jgi:hypothetical protein
LIAMRFNGNSRVLSYAIACSSRSGKERGGKPFVTVGVGDYQTSLRVRFIRLNAPGVDKFR